MPNFSDRYTGIKAGTKPPGNDPQNVYEAIRHYGLIPEEMLPFDDSIGIVEDYYSFKGSDKKKCDNEGQKFLLKYVFKHEYLPRNSIGQIEPQIIKESLKRSSLAVAVYAWALDDSKYVRLGKDTHWTTIYGYVEGDYWKCYDSYPPFIKKLAWDFSFRTAKRIYIRKKTEAEKKLKESWWERWRQKLIKLSNA